MPLTVSRLRFWFATAAIFLAVVVAGFYFYGRLRARYALSQVPKQLGVDIQQSTQGFTLSKSEAGHTLFTIHASKAVQYKESGKAELRDVSVIVYGRQSNRYDQIYGSDFEYDPQSGDVTAKGEVHIDLEGNAEGPIKPDQAAPAELKNPVHLKTSGLVFNAKTGLASTNERIEFRVPQANGYATGASYDSKAATLTLGSHIVVSATGPGATQFTANHAVIAKGPNRAVFQGVRVARENNTFASDELIAYLRDDNTVEHIVATGNVHATSQGATGADLQAPRGDAWITANNQLKSAVFTGGVRINASGEQPINATAGKVDIAFGSNSRADRVIASDGVKLLQQSHGAKPSNAVEVSAAAINFELNDGRSLHQAVTSGAAQVTVLPPAADQNARTVATAGQFQARFNRQNRLEQLVGAPDVKVVSYEPGKPDKTSTSDRLEATFSVSGNIETLVQDGRFHYLEPASPGGSSREAWADRATYAPQTGALTLTGSPRVIDGGLTTTADSIRLERQSGDALGTGNVKTTYSELKPQPKGAVLASSDPIHVTAPSVRASRNGGVAIYSGGARLWQDASIIQAPVIEFNREQRKIVAKTAEQSAGAVITTFVQLDDKGNSTPVSIRSAQLTYTDAERLARFDGGVAIRGADTTLLADHADVYLLEQGQKTAKSSAGPSQVDKIVAEGHVAIQQPTRRATGEKLVYTAAEGKFTLTGGPPSIFDAERGKITGDSLTFFSRDDKVVAESGNASPTVTRTRITR